MIPRPGAALLTWMMACVFAAGCATTTEPAERSEQADKVAVYEGVPPGSRPYRLVRRVWTESWQSALLVPRHESSVAGESALRSQAVALGGDAIMNFSCYREAPDSANSRVICNGNVIKYNP